MWADFRDRLAADDRAHRLLNLALARFEEAGLVRERTTQRPDSRARPVVRVRSRGNGRVNIASVV